jgi:hypothetical protein
MKNGLHGIPCISPLRGTPLRGTPRICFGRMCFGRICFGRMCYALLFALFCTPAWSLDWEIPVFTMRYETAGGESEDPDDQTLLPSSLRNTVSLRMKEDAGDAAFGLTLRTSAKDYYLQAGDYSFLEAAHDGDFALGERWRLGYDLGIKSMSYPELDSNGLPKGVVSLKAGGSATFILMKGTSIEAGLGSRFDLAENPEDSLQAWVVTAALSSRLGGWVLGARFRGEYRLALGAASFIATRSYNGGTFSLQWDPNR